MLIREIIIIYIYKDNENKVKYYLLDALINNIDDIWDVADLFDKNSNTLNIVDIANNDIYLE